MLYSAVQITGLRINARRAVAFLRCTGDPTVDAESTFVALKKKAADEMRSRFDYWIDGGHKDNYFHGWPNDSMRKECFVFKRREGRTHHRFYGFLVHPRPATAPRFQVCVLVSHARKNAEHTDPTEINAVNALRLRQDVIDAVKRIFPDKKD